MASKPSIPKGTRDFSPVEVSKRNYIISKMRVHFENFGYQPIETPSFENSDTLMGKYGEEGDRLIFKILNSGDYISSSEEILKSKLYIDLVLNKDFFTIFLKQFPKNNIVLDIKSTSDRISNSDSERLKVLFDTFLKFRLSIIENAPIEEKWKKYIFETLEDNENKVSIYSSMLNIVWKNEFFGKENEHLWISDLNRLVIKIITKKNNSDLSNILAPKISEKALRYDLTVPFARYVVQHQSEIEFPFKRYQIQPVWRADRPQKGRFREFYQCDADVVGSTSLWQEVELVQLYDAVFADLGLNGVTIKINNRKILSGIAEVIGASDKLIDFTVALDKLDKIGEEGVKKEMIEKGISENALEKVQPLFSFTGTIEEKIEKLSVLLSDSEEGKKGIEELKFICSNVSKLGLKKAVLDLDVTLARGLNYYTGAIFEVAAPKEVAMGSIGGGGRYDDLTGIFGLKNMSGVGISFGLDRIYLVLEELNLFPQTVITSTQVMFLNFGEDQSFEAMQVITKLRNENIKSELYPDNAKIDKQFKHAERRGIPFVVKEISGDLFTLKNIISGEQKQVSLNDLISELK